MLYWLVSFLVGIYLTSKHWIAPDEVAEPPLRTALVARDCSHRAACSLSRAPPTGLGFPPGILKPAAPLPARVEVPLSVHAEDIERTPDAQICSGQHFLICVLRIFENHSFCFWFAFCLRGLLRAANREIRRAAPLTPSSVGRFVLGIKESERRPLAEGRLDPGFN